MSKVQKLSDFLTPEQIKEAKKLISALKIAKNIVEPNLKEIERKIGQPMDPLYTAYLILYLMGEEKHEK